jgi:hypothetical protein
LFLAGGAALGLSLATGSLSNAIEVTQTAFAMDESSETVAN